MTGVDERRGGEGRRREDGRRRDEKNEEDEEVQVIDTLLCYYRSKTTLIYAIYNLVLHLLRIMYHPRVYHVLLREFIH